MSPDLRSLSLHPRRQASEPFDSAAAAVSPPNLVSLGADAVVIGLEVEAGVEIEGGAFIVQLGPEPPPVPQHEIDRGRPGQHRAGEPIRVQATRSLALLPLDRPYRPGPDWDAQNYLVPDDHPADDLLPGRRIGGDSEERREKPENRKEDHEPATISVSGLAASLE